MCRQCNYTIHAAQHHLGWDNAIAPVQTVAPGSTIRFACMEASGGQLNLSSTADDIATLDFGRINPVNGPIHVDGAEPGDALKITLIDFAPQAQDGQGWGWTANIPGFGLLADQFPDPALTLWRYDAATLAPALWGSHGRVGLKPFAGTIGVALAEPGAHSIVPPRRTGMRERRAISGRRRRLLPRAAARRRRPGPSRRGTRGRRRARRSSPGTRPAWR